MRRIWKRRMKPTFTLLAGWLIDGTGEPLRKDCRLVVSDGVILAVERADPGHPACAVPLDDPEDYSDCTLLPGMVDSHVHLALSGEKGIPTRDHRESDHFETGEKRILRHLKDHLSNGIVAVRDGGDRDGLVSMLREKMRKNSPTPDGISPCIRSPGRAWHAPGRYGGFIGRIPFPGCSLAESILKEGPGPDHVKILNSGLNSLSHFAAETPPQFRTERLKAAVRAGRRLGLKTMVHANGREAVRVALEAGCDSIEHGYFMGTDNLARMAEKKITWVPTVFAMESYARILPRGSSEREIARKNRDHQLQQIHTALKYGVKMALGTDAGSPGVHHGPSLREEMGLLVRAGLTLEKAVRCGTARGASLLGMEDAIGTLQPGMPATFLVFRGRPQGILDPAIAPERVCIEGKMVAGYH